MTIQIDPDRIAKHGQDVARIKDGNYETARKELNDNGTVEGGDFSIVGNTASMLYPMGLQFAYETLNSHKDMLADFAKKVDNTAKTYRASEQSSTIKTV
jgi:hypothetical protein